MIRTTRTTTSGGRGIRRRPLLTQMVALTLLLTCQGARAALPQVHEDADPLTVELLTMGPGRHPFFKFGHNAIRIVDRTAKSDLVYNFGTFDFDSPRLIIDFFKGRAAYWLSEDSYAVVIAHYRAERRGMIAQRLALAPAEKQALQDALKRNARPENRRYKYDYFFDNCSTRLRDLIDRSTQGRLHDALRGKAQFTLREHALRATAGYFPEYVALLVLMGPLVDRPRDRWAETFLPEVLAQGVRSTTLQEPDGESRSLVLSERVVLKGQSSLRAKPPQWFAGFLGGGLSIGAVIGVLGYLRQRSRAVATAFASLVSIGGIATGLLGCLLLSNWLLTDHVVAYANHNLLVISPLALGLPFCIRRDAAKFRALAWVLLLSAVVALLMRWLPFERQDDRNLLAFFLPCWFGLWLSSFSSGKEMVKVQAGWVRPSDSIAGRQDLDVRATDL